MKDYIEEIQNKVQISEGSVVIEKLLTECYGNPGISTKELARRTLLPVPVAAAIKKELIKSGLLEQLNGVRCTEAGKVYMEETKGFGGIDMKAYRQLMNMEGEMPKEWEGMLKRLQEIFQQRPQADVRMDQAKCTVGTSVRRAVLCLREQGLIGKRVLCVGDDDLTSVAMGFLLKLLFPRSKLPKKGIGVIDLDERFLAYIEKMACRENLPITCYLWDLRKNIPPEMKGNFDCILTDPPYTMPGLKLFLSRGVEALKEQAGLPIFLSFAHKSPEVTLEMHREFMAMELMVSGVTPRFNEYEGAEMIGNRGQMIVLQTTGRTKPGIVGEYSDVLYTGEMKRTLRTYSCKRCKGKVNVGLEGRYPTVEILKKHGCPGCGHETFDLMEREHLK